MINNKLPPNNTHKYIYEELKKELRLLTRKEFKLFQLLADGEQLLP